MKLIVTIGLVLATIFQVEARSIGYNDEMPKILKDTMEQSFSCALQMGPKSRNIPRMHGLDQLPEDNEALNELWGCIFAKKGLVDLEGNIDADILHTYLMDMFTIFVTANDEIRNMADEITGICKDVEGANYKRKAVKLQNCINQQVKLKTGYN